MVAWLVRFVAVLLISAAGLEMGLVSQATAQDRLVTLFDDQEPKFISSESGAPIRLVSSAAAANPQYTVAPTWTPTLQTLQGLNDIADFMPIFDNAWLATPSWYNSNPSGMAGNSPTGASGNSGSGLDALPSFRGIKGIKNLPGGVGTLLMANPHVGFTWYPEQSTDQPGTSLSMERYYFQGAVPVYTSGPNTFVLTGHYDETRVHTNAILPTTMQAFPTQLISAALGVNYFRQLDNGRVAGVVLDVGSASDKPFNSGREILASGTAFLLTPRDENSSWFVGVNASTNSQVLYGIPIPGGGYFYHPSENLQAIVGFPFSVVSWKPAPDWQLQYVYAFLTTMHARAVYQPTQQWQAYAGFDWTNENWRRAERVDENAHFFYYEKKLSTGFVWWFRPKVGLELSGGYAFDRYFSEIDGFKLVGDNTVRVGDGPYCSAQIDVRF